MMNPSLRCLPVLNWRTKLPFGFLCFSKDTPPASFVGVSVKFQPWGKHWTIREPLMLPYSSISLEICFILNFTWQEKRANILDFFFSGLDDPQDAFHIIWAFEFPSWNEVSPDAYLVCIKLFLTLWAVAYKPPLSVGFPKKEYWSEFPFPPLGDLSNPGIEPMPPTALALQVESLPTVPYGSPCLIKLSMIRLYFDIELYMQ